METEGEIDDSQDTWTSSGEDGVWRREHVHVRRRPGSRLKRTKMTGGKLDDNSGGLIIADDWTERRTAHRDLQRSLTGTASFKNVSDLISGSEPVNSESELDQAEETTSYKKAEEPVISEPTSIDQVRFRRSAGRTVEVRPFDQVAIEFGPDSRPTAWIC